MWKLDSNWTVQMGFPAYCTFLPAPPAVPWGQIQVHRLGTRSHWYLISPLNPATSVADHHSECDSISNRIRHVMRIAANVDLDHFPQFLLQELADPRSPSSNDSLISCSRLHKSTSLCKPIYEIAFLFYLSTFNNCIMRTRDYKHCSKTYNCLILCHTISILVHLSWYLGYISSQRNLQWHFSWTNLGFVMSTSCHWQHFTLCISRSPKVTLHS